MTELAANQIPVLKRDRIKAAISAGKSPLAPKIFEMWDPRDDLDVAMVAAVQNEDFTMLTLLLEENFRNGGSNPSNALDTAVEQGSVEIVQMLLEARITPKCKGCKALCTAVKQGSAEILQMLLEARIDPNYEHSSFLDNDYSSFLDNDYSSLLAKYALQSDQKRVEMLLDLSADIKNDLEEFTRLQNYQAARLLLEASSKRFSRLDGCRALGIAILKRNLPLVSLLLNDGVSPKRMARERIGGWVFISDLDGNALATAIRTDFQQGTIMIRTFLSHESDLNTVCAPDFDGSTPLMCAVEARNLSAMEVLIESGAAVDHPASRKTRRTALQFVSEQGYLKGVMLLLDHEADVNAPPERYMHPY